MIFSLDFEFMGRDCVWYQDYHAKDIPSLCHELMLAGFHDSGFSVYRGNTLCLIGDSIHTWAKKTSLTEGNVQAVEFKQYSG